MIIQSLNETSVKGAISKILELVAIGLFFDVKDLTSLLAVGGQVIISHVIHLLWVDIACNLLITE